MLPAAPRGFEPQVLGYHVIHTWRLNLLTLDITCESDPITTVFRQMADRMQNFFSLKALPDHWNISTKFLLYRFGQEEGTDKTYRRADKLVV